MPPAKNPGSWRYQPGKGRLPYAVAALLVSAGLHVFALFGFNDPEPVVVAKDDDFALEVVFLEMPPLEDLDEPEEIFDGESTQEEIAPGQYVPQQADIPTFNTDAVFVQQMDLKSLLPPPEFDTKVLSIPKQISHSRVDPAQIKDVFNLADLDRIPRAIFQPEPVFPRHLKYEITYAEVRVEFIVDKHGKVPWANAVSSTHRGFEDAAVVGVSRWQFRPGMKNGKAVNVRMLVPIRFRVQGD
jgi:periplasmic protein TonB